MSQNIYKIDFAVKFAIKKKDNNDYKHHKSINNELCACIVEKKKFIIKNDQVAFCQNLFNTLNLW